jgi:hypothetical protein
MPVQPFIVQRRYRELGRIRIGEKGEKGQPVKRDTFRLTSLAPDLLERAAGLWGGAVQVWEGAPTQGTQWELATEATELPVLVPPQDLGRSQYMELWSGGGVKRRCDGQTELLSGRACLCNPDAPECSITTHLLLVLPQIPDLGVWRLTSRGFNAAAELPSTVALLGQVYDEGQMPGAKLAIEHRTSKVEGQTRHFVVPVLRVPYSLQELAGGETHQGVPVLGRVSPKPALPEGPGLPEETAAWQGDGAEHGAPPALPGEEAQARTFESITEGQMKALQAGCKDMTREQRIRWGSGVLGRNLASFNDLRREEAKQLLDLLAADPSPSQAAGGSGDDTSSAEATGPGAGVDTSSESEASAGGPERPSEDPIVNDEPHKGKHLSEVAQQDPQWVRDLISRTRVKKRKELAQAWLDFHQPVIA